ncbi:hypothetical protein [Stenotrophomonas sp.]|uniref:hypothetical protein n=1 Tax=Stenotrophomonas sp. TaxID=69392 RepID=UPI0028ABE073|nr:hypothetical protein [Stenotrophomonas sp.]
MTNTTTEASKPAAAQEAVAWTKTKPTAEGAYYVRGFNLFQLAQYEALVQVRTHHFDGEPAPELVCNIHESTSNADMDDWSPIVEISEDFEWFGPLYAAPVAAAPVDDVQLALIGRRHFNGPAPQAWYAAARELLASTPAAPGIDLAPRQMATAPRDGTMVRLLVQFDDHATEDTEGPAWTIGACNDDNVGDDEHVGWQFAGWCWDHDHFTEGKGTPVGWLPLLDASPKGGSGKAEAHALMAAEYQRWLDFFHAGNGDFNDFLRKELPEERMQATSAEGGE